jgi:hypothetical protein
MVKNLGRMLSDEQFARNRVPSQSSLNDRALYAIKMASLPQRVQTLS